MLLKFREFGFAFEYEHDFEAVFLGGGKEDEAPEIADVLGVVGEVGVEFKVEVDIKIECAYDGEAIGESFLVEYQ